MENKEKTSLSEMMETSMSKVREMVSSDTVIGQPITTPDGVTLVPVSRLSFGFTCGGSDFGKQADGKNFAGGTASAVKVGSGGVSCGEGWRDTGDAGGDPCYGNSGPHHRNGAPGHGPGGELPG